MKISAHIDHSRIRHEHALENMKVRLGWTNIKHGRSKYCCVPGCKSSFYNNIGEKTNISFFSFPLEAKRRNRWLLAMKTRKQRRICCDGIH